MDIMNLVLGAGWGVVLILISGDIYHKIQKWRGHRD